MTMSHGVPHDPIAVGCVSVVTVCVAIAADAQAWYVCVTYDPADFTILNQKKLE